MIAEQEDFVIIDNYMGDFILLSNEIGSAKIFDHNQVLLDSFIVSGRKTFGGEYLPGEYSVCIYQGLKKTKEMKVIK